MVESADYDDATAAAVAIGSTNLVGTGLARESGGNLDTHTSLLSGASTGALISGIGRTVAQEVAAMIASGTAGGTPGGAPLLHGVNRLYSNASQVLAAGASFTPPNITFTRPGYIIRVTGTMGVANSALPTFKIHTQWRVNVAGNGDVDEQEWWCPAGGTGTIRTIVKGPVQGDTLNVTFTNLEAVNSCTLTIDIHEMSWGPTRHDGRSNIACNGANWSAANNQMDALVVANDSFTAPGSATTIRSLPLYAGQVDIWINQNVAGGSQVSVVPIGAQAAVAGNPIASLDWTAAPHQIVGVILPRIYCGLEFTNNAAGGQIATFGVTALEYAS